MRKLTTLIIFLLTALAAMAQQPRAVLFKRSPVAVRLEKARPLDNYPDTVSILFMGDVMLHRDQIINASREDGTFSFSTYFSNVSSMLQEADMAVANMEFTLGGQPYTGYPSFSAPDSYATYAADSGIDVFLTANNHILDRGKSGLQRTLRIYDEMESCRHLKYTGTAMDDSVDSERNPLVVFVKGKKIALVNFTYGTNNEAEIINPVVKKIDTVSIARSIKAAKDKGVDYIIALPHWGIEYALTHSVAQRRLATWLAKKGCDAVIGAHPHVVQDMEVIHVEGDGRDVPVVYSMGNVISNMSATSTRVGLFVTLRIVTFDDGHSELLELVPTFTWCTRPGTLTQSYSTIPVKEFLGKRDSWISPWDYDNMVQEYEHVKKETKIED